jgi:hypothetical protein
LGQLLREVAADAGRVTREFFVGMWVDPNDRDEIRRMGITQIASSTWDDKFGGTVGDQGLLRHRYECSAGPRSGGCCRVDGTDEIDSRDLPLELGQHASASSGMEHCRAWLGLGEVDIRADRLQFLHDEPPAGRRLQRDLRACPAKRPKN